MKIFFFIVFTIHSIIHVLGFLKAFQFANITQLTQQISKPLGILWLVTLLLLLISAIQFIGDDEIWWMAGLAGIILSQILIIFFWQDAKYGTIPNILILLVAITALADWNFKREVKNEILEMFEKNSSIQNQILNEDKVKDLPYPVKNWLKRSGAVGKETVHSVRLKQIGKMKTKPKQESWYNAQAVQYFTIDNPAFIWRTKVDMMPLVYFTGRDYFGEGEGKMLIKAFSLINIVNAADEKINQGTMQRFLGEIVWFPSAAVSDYIKWEAIDSSSARATMNYKGTTASGIFYFTSNGEFEKFITMRYMGSGSEGVLKEWIVTVNENQVLNGIQIPTKMDVSWKLESGNFKWFVLEVYDVEYNKPELF